MIIGRISCTCGRRQWGNTYEVTKAGIVKRTTTLTFTICLAQLSSPRLEGPKFSASTFEFTFDELVIPQNHHASVAAVESVFALVTSKKSCAKQLGTSYRSVKDV
eukprot:TRINITY_DN51070_c0_g1_i1.p1 TRINITY_DN51070_c0_g1~~TRINITY_DN51070_c0_g1_i1.p1  ORF type:complete len:119 (+),score=5.41 TRINITY_DN51070_c0_g1_i1:43-357(+)